MSSRELQVLNSQSQLIGVLGIPGLRRRGAAAGAHHVIHLESGVAGWTAAVGDELRAQRLGGLAPAGQTGGAGQRRFAGGLFVFDLEHEVQRQGCQLC